MFKWTAFKAVLGDGRSQRHGLPLPGQTLQKWGKKPSLTVSQELFMYQKDIKVNESSEAKLLIHIRNFTEISKASLRNKTMKALCFPHHDFEPTFPPSPCPPFPLPIPCAVIFPTPISQTSNFTPPTFSLGPLSTKKSRKSTHFQQMIFYFFPLLYCLLKFRPKPSDAKLCWPTHA